MAVDGKGLRYEFFGVSNDDRAYIWAEFDASTGLLADNPLPGNSPAWNPSEKDPAYQAYVAETIARLQKGKPEDFVLGVSPRPGSQSNIGALDQMLSTLVVTP